MISRRTLLEAAGAGAAMVATGAGFPKLIEAEAAIAELSPGVPGNCPCAQFP